MQTLQNCRPRTDSNSNKSKQSKTFYVIQGIFFGYLLILASPVFADHQGRVSGFIRTEKGEPLTGIHVRLEGTSHASITDEEGRFEIENVASGKYTFLASGMGYEAKKENIEVKPG